MNIEIYSKDNCKYCDMAIDKAINNYGADVEVFKLGKDFNKEELLKKFPGAKTFPQIKINGISIGGWDQFKHTRRWFDE